MTTPAGLEGLAAAECAELAGWTVERTERGVVEVTVRMDRPENVVHAARKLRMAQRLLGFVVRDALPAEELGREGSLAWMQARARADGGPALLRLLPVWRAFHADCPDDELAFHVRASRGGRHPFSSDDAKRAVALGVAAGSGLRGACRLEHQLHLDVRVHHESVWAGLRLLNTRQEAAAAAEAAPSRELSVTTLNATIAHAMLRVLQPSAGSLVVDPMAGCGTLPQLGCAAQCDRGAPCFFIAADCSPVAAAKSRANLRGGALCDVVLWDATRLPLRSGIVDHFVSDLPFGKRLGSKAENRQLYPESLEQMRRALRPAPPRGVASRLEAARLVLLSADRHALTTAVRAARGRPWRVLQQHRVNVGGLDGLLVAVALASRADERTAHTT